MDPSYFGFPALSAWRPRPRGDGPAVARHFSVIERASPPAHPIVWIGIIISEQASLANDNGSPLKALELAKRARDILEKVEKTAPVTMDAGAPTTLGVLYDRVPGFPIGFGDKARARHYLEEAIRSAPNGLDANYFYGDFLYRHGEQAEAATVLERALTLPELSNRPIWDKSRRAAIREILSDMQNSVRH